MFLIGSKEAAMGMRMLPFLMIVLGMIMSMRLCGHGFGHARCWPVLHAYVGQGLTDIRFGCFGSAEFNANSPGGAGLGRSEEHTSELQSLMRISYAVFCLKKKKQ